MAEEPQVIRGINWRDAFPFTHIFRAFRIAVHPSKLVLAFLALLALYLGGRILDGLWVEKHRAVPGEIEKYESLSVGDASLQEWRSARRDVAARPYVRLLMALHKPDHPELDDPQKALQAAQAGMHIGDVKWRIKKDLSTKIKDADKAYKEARKTTDDEKKAAAKAREESLRAAYADAYLDLGIVDAVHGVGLFDAFLRYQTLQINKIWVGVLANNWLGGLPGGATNIDGVVLSTAKFFSIAPAWALRCHWFYFLLFGAIFLIVWSTFGGAIARIAAVHVADEGRKLSVYQGLGFALSKFLSFISAPMIPLVIVLGIGLTVAIVGGIVMLVPYAGEILVSVLFFLALAAGFVMTLVLMGTIGGFNLMYPTIAVEGSDSFDAISRSFSYVYAKPWRMLFYSLLAIAYGSLTYLFVRVFIWLMLLLTHFFVGLLVFRHAHDGAYLWPSIWPAPDLASLPYHVNGLPLTWAESFASTVIAIWVYMVISMLGAFAISFYFSVNTIIYYLMRREVDATEMDDVYLEQPEADFAEAVGAPTPSPAPAAALPPTPPAPPVPEATSQPPPPPAPSDTPPPSSAPPAA